MSHNDYTKYSKDTKTETPEVEAVATVVETPVSTEPLVEPAPVVETKPDYPIGRVFGCARLNVRKTPKPRAEVVCEIACDTEVEIDEQNSTVDFYKIYTASGIEGYCVKTYISKKAKK